MHLLIHKQLKKYFIFGVVKVALFSFKQLPLYITQKLGLSYHLTD